MKRIAATGSGILLSALLAHFLIDGASRMDVESSPWSYRGLSQQTVLALNQVWSGLHGFASERDCVAAIRSAAQSRRMVRSKIWLTNADGSGKRLITVSDPSAAYQASLRASGAICPATGSIEDFGRFYARFSKLICPSVGFALFMILAGRRPSIHLWKPLAIVTAALALPWSPAWGLVCAAMVAAAMIAAITPSECPAL
jgi:hypothetical protein